LDNTKEWLTALSNTLSITKYIIADRLTFISVLWELSRLHFMTEVKSIMYKQAKAFQKGKPFFMRVSGYWRYFNIFSKVLISKF
jgi:hypothetical protein